jgi:hypothetical protein
MCTTLCDLTCLSPFPFKCCASFLEYISFLVCLRLRRRRCFARIHRFLCLLCASLLSPPLSVCDDAGRHRTCASLLAHDDHSKQHKKKRSYKSEEPGVGAFSINSGLLNACKDGHKAKQQQKRKTTRELKKNKRCRYWMALDDRRCCIDCAKEESSEFVFPSW